MVSAGRILILPQGTWDNATMYNMLDLVAYNGISWLCKRQCVGITPSVTATEYWQQFGSSAPIASTTVAGLVMPDGQTITINTTTGAIAVPTATAAALGLVKVDGTSITIDQNGVISSAGGNLSNLGDVAITSLANGQVLIWNQTNQKWQNGTIAGALSALSDVTITSATDGQILAYDSIAGKWVNATAQATLSSSTKPIQTAVVKNALTDVVETVGAGASQAYAAGDIIVSANGTQYKATTDIAQNTTLTVGGNIEATSNRALITNLTAISNKVIDFVNYDTLLAEVSVTKNTTVSKSLTSDISNYEILIVCASDLAFGASGGSVSSTIIPVSLLESIGNAIEVFGGAGASSFSFSGNSVSIYARSSQNTKNVAIYGLSKAQVV